MKAIFTMIALAMMTSVSATATNRPDVVGTVYDENGDPMPYANVVLLSANDSTYIMGATTDDSGSFNIKTPETDGILKISSIGYTTKYINVSEVKAGSSCVVRMENDSRMLDEVVVKSLLPKTRVQGDAMRTIVAGSILEKSGTATDMLNKIPSLSAEKDGGVTVFGRGDAEVYINGRKVQDLKELSRLRAEQIQSVDVVHNPGARYAANVKAVVRIQLKKAQGEGFSFTDDAMGVYQYGLTGTNNLDLNYRKGGLDVTGSFWAGSYGHTESHQENNMSYYVGPDKIYAHSVQNHNNRWEGWSPQLQLNYMINDNHSLGAFYKFDNHPYENSGGILTTESYKNGEFEEFSESDINQGGEFKKHIFNAYYNGKIGKLGIDFNVDGLFDKTNDPNSTHETTTLKDGTKRYTSVDNNTDSKNNFWATKLIFSYPVWKGNLSVGGEYSHNNRNDAYSFVSEEQLAVTATDTDIKESMGSAFAEYGRSFGKFYTQVGIRYEYLNNEYFNFGVKENDVCRKYGDWFPTATVSTSLKNWQLSLSYRRDIERPSYSSLSSSTIYINKYSYQSGNPYLKPTYTHSIVFNAAYKTFNFTLNYGHINDAVCLLTEPYPGCSDPFVSLIRPKNADKSYDRLVINPSYRPTIGIWHPMWSAGLVLQNFQSLNAEGEMITMNKPYGQFVWNNDFELPKGWRLNAMMQFSTKGDYDNFRMTKCIFDTKFGVQKDFNLHTLGTLTVDARIYDPFNIKASDATIMGIRELTSYNPSRRTFQLNLTWKFNEARSKYKGSGAGSQQKARMK